MEWLSEHGVAQNYEQYLDLPKKVIDHCRLVMAAQFVMKDDGAQPTQNLLKDEGVA